MYPGEIENTIQEGFESINTDPPAPCQALGWKREGGRLSRGRGPGHPGVCPGGGHRAPGRGRGIRKRGPETRSL